jgi:Rps23 Pro-64 3,4-dihydroxylase Tpa1-like proline 4-hydroxylase
MIAAIMKKFETARDFELNTREVNGVGRWPLGLSAGAFSPVFVLRLDEFAAAILEKFKRLDPIFEIHNKVTCFLHVWLKGSQINWHHDGNGRDEPTRISASIYLNEKWHRDWGGLFLYESNGTKFLEPAFNLMTWFVGPMWHATSMVTQLAETPRLSVQLFFNQ